MCGLFAQDEELYVYSTFGSWHGDETPLKEVKGDLKYFRRGPQEGTYEMTVSLPDNREVKVDVADDYTVADVKKQVAQVRSHSARFSYSPPAVSVAAVLAAD